MAEKRAILENFILKAYGGNCLGIIFVKSGNDCVRTNMKSASDQM